MMGRGCGDESRHVAAGKEQPSYGPGSSGGPSQERGEAFGDTPNRFWKSLSVPGLARP